MSVRQQLYLFVSLILILAGLLLFTDAGKILYKNIKLDTTGHFISFFLLGALLHHVIKISLFVSCSCLIFYGALSELGQYYLGFRNAEFRDFYADALGVLAFALLQWCIHLYRKRTAI
ncbi:VanZ family protein [Thalassomonas viridans]|uniref:VanZ family protein n=1 Tax=Thalassomonas viridans TaxID=137584 RepID=A0AAE9Z5K5_9GAMM|nr:VanZ family protein [Thalassomonas viridans]WDE06489.1 VanZ family protein [Thalassomonas viridans]